MPTVPLERALPASDLALLRALGVAASAAGARLWLVGGAVRDALLERRVTDLDLTSATPARELAPALAAATGATVGARSAFGTVKLRLGRRVVDLATLRLERYDHPGALPSVGPGDVLADLARRDFSINAMAASLAPADFGELLDPEGGLRDLRAGRIRILHERSLQDDATRILRAVRYSVRLGFAIDRGSAALLRRDLAFLDAISPARLRRELERMLAEPLAARMLTVAWRRGVLAAVHPALDTPALGGSLRRAARARLTPLALLGVLVYASTVDSATAMASRLALTRMQASTVAHTLRTAALEPRIAGAAPSSVHELVGGASADALQACAVAAADPAARQALARYVRRLRIARPLLDGNDLKSLGVEEGPGIGALLDELRRLALDGNIRTRGGAIAYVKRALAEGRT